MLDSTIITNSALLFEQLAFDQSCCGNFCMHFMEKSLSFKNTTLSIVSLVLETIRTSISELCIPKKLRRGLFLLRTMFEFNIIVCIIPDNLNVFINYGMDFVQWGMYEKRKKFIVCSNACNCLARPSRPAFSWDALCAAHLSCVRVAVATVVGHETQWMALCI